MGNRVRPSSSCIAKDGRWQHVFTLDLPSAARLTAQIEPGDAYIFDNTAVLDVPAAPAMYRVMFVGDERSCLKEILAANRRVELIQNDAETKAIHVIDGKTPERLPPGPVLIFSPGGCDLWQVGEAVADPLVTLTDDKSSIMADVRLFDAYLPEARQLQIANSMRAVSKPILWAGTTPLGYAIDRPQGRVVVIAGNLATSNLALQAAFPQLIAQSLDWLDGQPPWKDEVVGQHLVARHSPGADVVPPCGQSCQDEIRRHGHSRAQRHRQRRVGAGSAKAVAAAVDCAGRAGGGALDHRMVPVSAAVDQLT